MLNEIRSGTQAGRSTEADVAQAEARLANARATESSVRQSLRISESQFIKAAGEKPDILVMPNVPTEQLQPNVDEAVKVAMTETPTLGIFEADADVAWQEYEATAANFYPQVDLQLQGRQFNDLGGSKGVDKGASAQVIANWNVFRGGIDTHLRREHVYRHAQAKERRAQEARNIEDDIRQTWAAMVASGERAKEFNAQADANSKVVSAYKDQFELDRRTLLDVLDSQNELFVSRSNAINAQYLEILAVYRILALQGRLLPALGVPAPREASLETKIN
jgi:adhesin transport system outer membrane protein